MSCDCLKWSIWIITFTRGLVESMRGEATEEALLWICMSTSVQILYYLLKLRSYGKGSDKIESRIGNQLQMGLAFINFSGFSICSLILVTNWKKRGGKISIPDLGQNILSLIIWWRKRLVMTYESQVECPLFLGIVQTLSLFWFLLCLKNKKSATKSCDLFKYWSLVKILISYTCLNSIQNSCILEPCNCFQYLNKRWQTISPPAVEQTVMLESLSLG